MKLLSTISLIIILFAFESLADKNIVILNSDQTVDKYALVQQSFLQTASSPVKIVDMGGGRLAEMDLLRMIAKWNPNLIYCIGSKAAAHGSQLFHDRIKLVTSVINWQRLPFDARTYGIANELPAGMQINLFRLFFPDIRKIGVLYSPNFNEQWLETAVKVGRHKGIEIIGFSVMKPVDVSWKMGKMFKQVEAVWLISDPIVISSEKRIQAIFSGANLMKIPIFAYDPMYAELGAALTISADVPTIGGQAGELANDILGKKPVTIMFQPPAGSEITINMVKIEEYGIKLDKRALSMVNRIIK